MSKLGKGILATVSVAAMITAILMKRRLAEDDYARRRRLAREAWSGRIRF